MELNVGLPGSASRWWKSVLPGPAPFRCWSMPYKHSVPPRSVQLAQALSLMGSPEALPTLIEILRSCCRTDALPGQAGSDSPRSRSARPGRHADAGKIFSTLLGMVADERVDPRLAQGNRSDGRGAGGSYSRS